mmetsp:Transcript_12162/g.22167  ORF Transcript_12162/g.22167 Transcript_12162/m.22167 type:complete len:200 (+) Transcript_12162:250-849(+)|eukprot:CAMPEP_0197529082 /NCGR_PEP_ID=MMETSP1318-20131121/27143_1 /TAXON_ID=552666 /ORGANISM="Partenskyella glossopodia, Strain RCC365" /LENGTH=199 /DNA_ID=CAMNT_0043084411 /DNA_START=234 /DNA_END=833 /DNA_ORIENTATION=+
MLPAFSLNKINNNNHTPLKPPWRPATTLPPSRAPQNTSSLGVGLVGFGTRSTCQSVTTSFQQTDGNVSVKASVQLEKPDSQLLKAYLTIFSKTPSIDVIITLGSNGYSKSDIAPDVVGSLISSKEAFALSTAVSHHVSSGGLPASRTVAGSNGQCLLLTLSDNVEGAVSVIARFEAIFRAICDEIKGGSGHKTQQQHHI